MAQTSPKIKIKRGSTFPLQVNFEAGELALNTSTNALYAAIADNGGSLTNAGPGAGTVTVDSIVATVDHWTAVLTATGTNYFSQSITPGSVISVTGSTTATVGVLVPAAITAGAAINSNYTSATLNTSSATGSGLTVTVAHTSGATYTTGNTTITVMAGGSGYTAGDTITVSGANNALGTGSTTSNNLVFTLPANFNVSLGGVITSNAAPLTNSTLTLSISSKGSAPRPGVLTGTVQYAPGLKWVGAEIEDYVTSFGSRTKLATQGAIKDYINTVGASGVTIVDAGDNNADYFPTFVTGASTQSLKIDNTSNLLKYNPSTGVLTSAYFTGALTGNSSGTHTGSVTMSGTQTLETTGGSVSLSPTGIAAPTVTISPSGSTSGAVTISPTASSGNGSGSVTISPTGIGSGVGTVTIVPTGLLTLGKAGVGTTLSGNLSAAENNQTVALSPTGTGTVTISPASTLTLGKAGAATTLLGNLSAAENNQTVALSPIGTGTVTISPAGTLTLGKAGAGTTLLGNLSAGGSNQTVALSPTGSGTVTINPATASTINNCSIGATTPLAGTFTNLTATTSATINGNFTINGTQTYLNTTVMTVTDKNIELGTGTGTTGSSFTSTNLATVPSFGNFSAKLSLVLGNLWKLTFTSGTIPVGVRVGTTLAQTGLGSTDPGYIGSTATVVSVTPTEIYYNATGTNVPVATTGSSTFTHSSGPLTVTNEFTGSVTITGTNTTNMLVGSAISVISGTALTSPAVAQINSATTLVIVVRASVNGAACTFDTGSTSDITADGGGITVKSTTGSVNTDKTLSWVSGTKNWTFNQGLEVSAVATKPGLTVNTYAITDVAMVGLVLSNYNTGAGGTTAETSPAIQFKSGTSASTSTTGYLLVTSGQQFEFHTATRGTKAFTVSSTGQVGDCTIDCGQY